jgi:hypothetical protein
MPIKRLIPKSILFILITCCYHQAKAQFAGASGLEWEDSTYASIPRLAAGFASINIPKVISLKNRTPYPGDQGGCKTCVGWSVAYAAYTTEKNYIDRNDNKELISRNAFSPLFFNYVLKKSTAKPMRITEALNALKQYGDCLQTDFKLDCFELIRPGSYTTPVLPEYLLTKASTYRINGYEVIFGLNSDKNHKINATKIALANGRPVIVGVKIYFPSITRVAPKDSVWKPDTLAEAKMEGHAVCVVGYNDFSKTFELINSWGENWGNKGYMSISYDDFASVVKYGYELTFGRKVFKVSTPESRNDFIRFEKLSAKEAEIQTDHWTPVTFGSDDQEPAFNRANLNQNDYLKIKLFGKPGDDAYVYLINQKPDHSFEMLFPFGQNKTFGPNYGLLRTDAELPHLTGYEILEVPGQGKALAEPDKGEDILIFILAKEPITDYAKLAAKLSASSRPALPDKLKEALGAGLQIVAPDVRNTPPEDAEVKAFIYQFKID